MFERIISSTLLTQIGVLAQAPQFQKGFGVQAAVRAMWVVVKEVSDLCTCDVDGNVVLGAQPVGLALRPGQEL